MQAIEQILEKEDAKLIAHLRANAFTPQIYAWPLLKSLFTEILSKDDWLRLMDHLFTYKEDPELILFYLAAILISQRTTLLNLNSVDDLIQFQSKAITVPFKKISTLAHKMHSQHKQTLFTGVIQQALPIPVGESYPVFSRYP